MGGNRDGQRLRRRVRALTERAKELTAMHGATRAMLRARASIPERLAAVADLLPAAMQRPELATAAVHYAGRSYRSGDPSETGSKLVLPFRTSDGAEGEIEVGYRDASDAPAFLAEEETLLESIADVVRAVLDRDANERALLAEQERFNLALDAAGMGVWEWDVDAGTTRWSSQLSRQLGLEGEPAGRFGAHRDRVHPDDRDMVFGRLERAAEGEDDLRSLELRMRKRDGGWVHFAATARIVRDRPPRASRIVVALLDVTERRALEEGLRRAQKQEALAQVASGVAHDLNNLFAVLSSGTDLLRAQLPKESTACAEIAEDLHVASERCSALAQQLLTFSRRSSFEPTAVDLGVVCERLDPLLRRLAGRSVRVELEIPERVGLVWADLAQCEQVLMNLVVNARDAMPEGGVITIALGVIGGASAPGEVAIEVTDTGTGIDPAVRERIFEPFFTTKPMGQGTGLGLAVVASVAQRWGGRVEVDSELGRGTTFRVLFPRMAS